MTDDAPALIPIDNTRLLSRYGLRMLVVGFYADGESPTRIQQTLRDDYGFDVDLKVINQTTRQIRKDIKELQNVQLRRDLLELQHQANQHFQDFVDGYREAMCQPDYVDTVHPKTGDVIEVPNKHKLDLMRFYSQRFGEWWDRLGKFHLLGTPNNTMNIQVGEVNVNPVEIIMDEVRSGRINPDALDRIVRRLDGEDDAVDAEWREKDADEDQDEDADEEGEE